MWNEEKKSHCHIPGGGRLRGLGKALVGLRVGTSDGNQNLQVGIDEFQRLQPRQQFLVIFRPRRGFQLQI